MLPAPDISHVPMHLILPCSYRQACFHADEDRRFYLDCLIEYAGKTGCCSRSGDWVGHVAHGERQVREALGFAKPKTEPAVPVL